MPQISVIVPVYNVEAYLPACVESILTQTFADFELILVDDGSPDGCGALCDLYAQKDSRIKVIHQKNQGLSGARNAGLDIARGEYVTFIDSDDYVHEQYLEILYNAMDESTELATCRSVEFEDGTILKYKSYQDYQRERYDSRSALISLYNGAETVTVNAWGKLFRKALIAELRFPVGRIHEDQFFIPRACYQAVSIVFCDANLYFYRNREESIVRKKFTLKRYDDLWAIDSCIVFFQEKGEQEIVEAALRKRMRLLCVYSIYARRDKVEVPEEYRVSVLKAIRYLRKNVSPEKYQYYLAQIHPKLGLWFEYSRKIRKVLNF